MKPTPYRTRKILDYFQCLDTNRNGHVDWKDFTRSAHFIKNRLGWSADSRAFRSLLDALQSFWDVIVSEMDADGDGTVSRDEFVGFFTSLARAIQSGGGRLPEYASGHTFALLQALDLDGNFSISEVEYALYLESIGSTVDAEEAFSRLDLNGDGRIDFTELEALYVEWVVSDDPAAPGSAFVTGRA